MAIARQDSTSSPRHGSRRRWEPVASAAVGMLACLAATVAVRSDARAAAGDPVPVIATYEMRQSAVARHEARRDPKAFWLQQIVTRIESKVARSPLRLKTPVVVHLAFVVAHDGHLVSQAIATSSGIPVVDAAATQILNRAAPFPPMPAVMTDSEQSFTLPMRFK